MEMRAADGSVLPSVELSNPQVWARFLETPINQAPNPASGITTVDPAIKNTIALAPALAEIYYADKASYAGVCTSVDGILGTKNKLTKLPTSVVCKDSPTAWAMSAQLKDVPSQHSCSDSMGVVMIRTSPITTTSCK
jgi:hypothetical protein